MVHWFWILCDSKSTDEWVFEVFDVSKVTCPRCLEIIDKNPNLQPPDYKADNSVSH